MRFYILIVIFIGALIVSDAGRLKKREDIEERSIFGMYDLISCMSDKNPLSLNPYGCFCGIGSWGDTAYDEIDTCCQTHDICYNDTINGGCSSWWFYLTGYNYEMNCTLKEVTCTDDAGTCSRFKCECDLEFAECVDEAPYITENKYPDEEDCPFTGN